MAQIAQDMASAEVKKEIDETRALATKLGIQGTPHFLVGDRVIPGAPENLLEQMQKHVAEVRKEGCKVCWCRASANGVAGGELGYSAKPAALGPFAAVMKPANGRMPGRRLRALCIAGLAPTV